MNEEHEIKHLQQKSRAGQTVLACHAQHASRAAAQCQCSACCEVEQSSLFYGQANISADGNTALKVTRSSQGDKRRLLSIQKALWGCFK